MLNWYIQGMFVDSLSEIDTTGLVVTFSLLNASPVPFKTLHYRVTVK